MNRIPLTVVCACCALFSSPVIAQSEHDNHADHSHAEADNSKPVNAKCPVGNEPIDEDVAKSMTNPQPAMDAQAADTATVPYIFNTCPISGEELGEMGDPIVKVYDGREVKFCCKMCVPKFEKDLKASLAALDQQIIDSQLPFYPTTTCIVSGESLEGEDMGDPINFVYKNRLIRFCCKMCKGDFKKDPEAYIAKLDAAVIAQQSENYPLTTCPISGEELGDMGEAINVVYAGRLVKFCCKMCVPKFEANPMPTIEKIDAAWMAMHDDE